MKYYYKIYFNDGQTKKFTDKALVGKNLPDLDKFSFTTEYQADIERGCQEMNLSTSKIDKVTIIHEKDRGVPTEYSMIGKNPYFYDIYNNLTTQEVWGYNHAYRANKDIISTESEAYKEMRDYLLNQLKRNADNFFKNVYKYDDKFKEVLVKYARSYTSDVAEEEEYRNIFELEKAIRYYLTFYKNFRKVATRRYKYELYGNYPKQPEPVEVKPLTKEAEAHRQKMMDSYYDRRDTVSYKTREFNEKYEEFLEPDEYPQMNGNTGGKVL